GTAVSCQVEGGQDTVDSLGGQAASCTVVVPPGTYNVQVPSPFNLTNSLGTVVGTAYVTSTNPQSINVKPGDQASVSFNSGAEPLLTVDVGGPEAPCDCVAGTAIWDNESVNGAVVMVSNQALGPWAPLCTVSGGSKTDGLVDGGGQQASCTTALPPGTYDISVGSPIFTNPPVYGNIATVTGLDDQVVTLSPGDAPTISFSTAWGNMQNVGTGPGSATTTDGLLSATGTGGGGTGTVTVGEYNSDPEGTAPAFASSDHYFDVMVSPDSTFASLTFTECGLQSGDELDWWDPNAANGGGFGWWEPVSPASAVSWSADGTCATVTITGSTYPDLAQMTGTVFAVSSPGPTGTTPAQAQTLNFDTANPSPVRVGGFYTPRATASSGLAVAFSIDAASSPGACTINDSGIVGFIGTGTCVVDANQGGGSGWQPAQQVQQAITVLPASSHVVVGLSGPKSAKSGKPFTYTLTVANDGPDAASNLAVSLQLGKETQILSASGSPSQQGGGPVDWSVAALWPGRSLTYTVSVSVTSHSPETLVAVATAVPQGSVDPDPSQETARATTRLTPFGPVTKGHRSLHPMRKVKKTHLLRKSHRAKPHRAKPHRARKSKGRPRSGAKASAT
ncbi:MAG TPA: hypothetical protein VFN61_03970, partial [Acidimicrobiales bacterium]|nr:hypothetical protein [Acidimicrobiales bacterium]